MSIFKKLSRNNDILSSFVIGCPEAEGETGNSSIHISDVFEDFLDIMGALNNGKFIIAGRKGSGKSAIAEYILNEANKNANVFANRIKMSDFKIHRILEISNQASIDEEFLIEWVLYTNFAQLLIQDQALSQDSRIKPLKKFLRYNLGYVNISDDAVRELRESHDWKVQFGPLADLAAKFKFAKKTEILRGKPHYYEILPVLRNVIKNIITDIHKQSAITNEYILFVDDLDVGITIQNRRSLDIIYELVKKTRDINLSFAQKFKIILLLRDDISKVIAETYPDSGKIFSSYAIFLNWYDATKYAKDENSVPLKSFINKRIKRCFDNAKIPHSSDVWYDLIKADFSNYDKSSFDVVLQSSFFKPRDIILFFAKLPEHNFSIPIQSNDFDELFLDMADGLFTEICNELTLFYSEDELDICKKTMHHFSKNQFSYEDFCHYVDDFNRGIDSGKLLERFWNYSIVGNITQKNDRKYVFFAHRNEKIDLSLQFIMSTPIRNHFNRGKLFY